jgi:ribosomal protein L16/L10AE
LDDTLRDVTTLLIRNDADVPTPPKQHPPHVTATVGIDNIKAIATSNVSEVCESFDPPTSSFAFETGLSLANPGSNANQQTFIRFLNNSDAATNVEIFGIDDAGHYTGTVDFMLEAQAAKQVTAQDLEDGNTEKGLNGSFCDGQGKWRIRVFSDNSVTAMGLVRTRDGFLTSLNDVVGDNTVYFANPASNTAQQTFLRIVNQSDQSGVVTVSGIDDVGTASPGSVSFSLDANEAKQITSQDLENGNVAKGLSGMLGDGTGKWRLGITSSLVLEVLSLIRSEDGFLTSLSGVIDPNDAGDHVVYFANPASVPQQQSFVRIINTGTDSGTVTVSAIDDDGAIAPMGDVMFTLGENQSKQVTAQDLENGNEAKGLSGMLGDGAGRWRLTVSSALELAVMSLIRTPDGFLTNLGPVTPTSANVNDVVIFNPASNTTQRSVLRIINESAQQGSVTISGIDDNGNPSPGSDVTFNIQGLAAMSISAEQLENGDVGIVGGLGDGAGKWRLQVQSDVDLVVQSLLETATGFLTNLSRPSE